MLIRGYGRRLFAAAQQKFFDDRISNWTLGKVESESGSVEMVSVPYDPIQVSAKHEDPFLLLHAEHHPDWIFL
jgi:hypothetical protein